MHTRIDASTDDIIATLDLTTTLGGHSRLSERPQVWHELVSGIRIAVTRLVEQAQDDLDAQR